ncbi:MAG: hypothetical protein AAGH57_07130 [Pseudomonadota bacterium]
MTSGQPFEPKDGERLVRVVDAYDAIAQFISSHYGALVETEDGLNLIYCDIFRGDPNAGGWPPDESTWASWVEACNQVTAIKSGQPDQGKEPK